MLVKIKYRFWVLVVTKPLDNLTRFVVVVASLTEMKYSVDSWVEGCIIHVLLQATAKLFKNKIPSNVCRYLHRFK